MIARRSDSASTSLTSINIKDIFMAYLVIKASRKKDYFNIIHFEALSKPRRYERNHRRYAE